MLDRTLFADFFKRLTGEAFGGHARVDEAADAHQAAFATVWLLNLRKTGWTGGPSKEPSTSPASSARRSLRAPARTASNVCSTSGSPCASVIVVQGISTPCAIASSWNDVCSSGQ